MRELTRDQSVPYRSGVAIRLTLARDPLMSTRPTPPLSPEGVAEIVAEMNNPPEDTPERRATFDRARAAGRLVQQAINAMRSDK
jgi:hypothetical protein